MIENERGVVYHSDYFDILPLEVKGWGHLPQDLIPYIYHLSESCLWGRDIIYLQHHRYGLVVRTLLEALWSVDMLRCSELEDYLARYWFHSGFYHSYEERKFLPRFSKEWFDWALGVLPYDVDSFLSDAGLERDELYKLIFDPDYEPIRRASGEHNTLLERSSVHFYEKGVGTAEAERYYQSVRGNSSIASGLNSFLYHNDYGELEEAVASTTGLYGEALQQIVGHLEQAMEMAPSTEAKVVLGDLVQFYKSGVLEDFATYSKAWVHHLETVDLINGFIETYTDPLGLKGSWEGILMIEDEAGTQRTKDIASLAPLLEEDSPIDKEYKRITPGFASNRSVEVITLAGDSYPTSPLGINLPNDERIRAEVGSKSVTLTNIALAIEKARQGVTIPLFFSGEEVIARQIRYGGYADLLHTDLHEGVGHASGRLMEGVTGDALGELDSVIEETRADLNALYFISHPLLRRQGLVQTDEIWKALYDGYLTKGILVQLSRLSDEPMLTQAHMQNRALIGWWTLDLCKESGAVSLIQIGDNHYVVINDYDALRKVFGEELREIQRIKSTGDYLTARELIRRYGTNVNPELLKEVKERYNKASIPPYVGFLNPYIQEVKSSSLKYELSTDEGYFEQNLRYSRSYSTLAPDISRYKKGAIHKVPEEWQVQVANIRVQLRRMMNGTVAESMRENGGEWTLNYGVTLLNLRAYAKTLPRDERLSLVLWTQTHCRELRLLAILTLPRLESKVQTFIQMIQELRTVEEAEVLVKEKLLASGKASEVLQLINSVALSRYAKLVPYLLLTNKLMSRDFHPSDEEIEKLLHSTITELKSEPKLLGMTLLRTYTKMAEAGGIASKVALQFAHLAKLTFSKTHIAYGIAEEIEDLIVYLQSTKQE